MTFLFDIQVEGQGKLNHDLVAYLLSLYVKSSTFVYTLKIVVNKDMGALDQR